jgi:hypothetical protein
MNYPYFRSILRKSCYQVVGSYQTMRKLTGNATAIPYVASVIHIMINLMVGGNITT